MLKAIAIDDEPIALEVIKNLSEKVIFLEMEGYFTNAFEATDYLQKNNVDLIFLDIKMPDMSGIELIKTLTDPPFVIFTTAYSEHAVQCFELDALDYLLKPFSLSRFLKACNKAYEQVELRKNNSTLPVPRASLFIKSGYEHIRIEMEDILFVESYGNYVQFVMNKQKILSRLTMSEVEELLPVMAFVRIHRSYIVAKNKITKIDRKSVWIAQAELPIGPGYSGQVAKVIR